MKAFVALAAVLVLVALAWVGVSAAGQEYLFGVLIPYAAIVIFLVGFTLRIISWARAPVPFRIPTVAGQQKSLDFLPHQKSESPFTTWDVVKRMFLEVFFFRSLFRNTKAEITPEKRLAYPSDKLLWAAGLLFHYSFLVIFIRHLRFFMDPTPQIVLWIEELDGFFQVATPTLFMTDILILVGLSMLLWRRMAMPQMRYISLSSDYFALFLLLGVVLSGGMMRYSHHVDITAAKEMAMGIVTLNPQVVAGIGVPFYVHVFLVSVLFAYFPFSKLMHLGGVFLSPTRNLPNNSRAKRHINPWNPPYDVIKPHTYDEWEDEFRDKLKAAGIPVERD